MDSHPSRGQEPMPPFTNGEVLRAFALVMPQEMAEAARQEGDASADAPCTWWVSDSILLVLATISEDFAQRVAAFRPDLGDRVEEVRRDPHAYIAAVRAEAHGSDEEPSA